MPALLERPKLSNAMARALHKHIMRERERKRQEEEEVDKMMEQKMKEEEERKRTKEIEERMSLEETKEQVMKMGEKLQGLQEEKHQLFLQLKKVLHEEEKRRRKEQSDITTLTSASYQTSLPMHAGQHLLSIQGSPVSHSRPGALLGDRSKQLFPTAVISWIQHSRESPVQSGSNTAARVPSTAEPAANHPKRRRISSAEMSQDDTQTRHYQTPAFSSGSAEHGQFSGAQSVHDSYGVAPSQHSAAYAPGPSVPVSFASSSQIRGASAFQAMQYLPHQQPGYPVHSHFTSQPGYIPGAGIPLQKQLEHANQQSGFTDAGALRPMHPPTMHPSAQGLLPTPSMAVQIPTAKAPFQSSPQTAPRHGFLPHAQSGQRFYHHTK
ncbi:G protein pathway suppressor 2 isoform X2 [Nerophis ophidion]|uniref:G protein pathway suppressor 2 isoform X2 n=1 Tax=Nerophis ophidion TaxID=159077 RepID=UPI002ADF875B|nr:G protein pathway suppressor 2 isoform X2 [Nerophis ophidion]